MESKPTDSFGQEVPQTITNEKQLLLSRLLARLAHEIRNPLSSLGIHLQLLEEDLTQATPLLRAQAAGRFEIIRGELLQLENLMRQYLSLAAPSTVALQPVDLAEVARYVADLLQPEAAARNIDLSLDLPADLPALMADAAQLKQALVNLIINAIQAIERDGRIEVGVRVDRGRGILALQVRDNGPGVPSEKRSAIFEPFFTTKAEGSGLGLWIVQQIAMAHGGIIAVGDPAGGGAVFTLELPLRETAVHG